MTELLLKFLDDGSVLKVLGGEAIMERAFECGSRGGNLLCELSQIPDASRERFLKEAEKLLTQIFILAYSINYPPEMKRALDDVETGLRAARSALAAAPIGVSLLLSHFFLTENGDAIDDTSDPTAGADKKIGTIEIEMFEAVLDRWIRHCSRLTGSSAKTLAKSGKRGRTKGARTKATFPLRLLVWKIARAVQRHGGRLKLDRAKQRGSWIEALNGLRPLFPKGFIPRVPQLSMIEDLQAKSNRTPLPS